MKGNVVDYVKEFSSKSEEWQRWFIELAKAYKDATPAGRQKVLEFLKENGESK